MLAAGTPAALLSAEAMLHRWGLLLVAIMVLAEFLVGLGYVAQANTTMFVAGAVYGRDVVLTVACIVIATAMAVLAAYASRRLGRAGKSLSKREADPKLVEAAMRAIRRRTAALAFAYHFSAWLRPIVPFAAGASGVAESRWLPWDFVGAACWSSTVFLLGAYVRGMMYRPVSATEVSTLLALVVLIGGGAFWARRMLVGHEEHPLED